MTTFQGTDADTAVAQYDLMIQELRVLQRLLNAGRAAQFSPPPGGTSDPAPNGIPNPTLDTVIDPRRMRLSQAMRETGASIADITAQLAHASAHLSGALSGWEGK